MTSPSFVFNQNSCHRTRRIQENSRGKLRKKTAEPVIAEAHVLCIEDDASPFVDDRKEPCCPESSFSLPAKFARTMDDEKTPTRESVSTKETSASLSIST
jgi:hypothetical protein